MLNARIQFYLMEKCEDNSVTHLTCSHRCVAMFLYAVLILCAVTISTGAKISDEIWSLTQMMRFECLHAGVEFVDLNFPSSPHHPLFEDSKHLSTYGAGLYSICILRHLSTFHRRSVYLVGPLCTSCHQTGHFPQYCKF